MKDMNSGRGHDRDWYKRAVMAAVILVAAIAAAVSFLHIRDVAIRYGQPPLAAYLLPVSVDGLVTVCSVALLRAARLGLSAPGLARGGLALGVLATLAANAVAGLAHGWPGAVVSAWAPVSFVVAAEVAISLSGQRRRAPHRTSAAAPVTRTSRTRARAPRTPRGGQTAAAVLSQPGIPARELGAQLGISDRTVRRVRAAANGSIGHAT